MMLTDAYIYKNHFSKNLTNVDTLYKFIIQLGWFLEQYYINTNIIKILYDNFRKRKIVIHIITRSGVKKFSIFPWRYVIQTDESAFEYVRNNKNVKDSFSELFLNLIKKDIDIYNVISINVNTNIKSINDYKLGY